MDNDGADLARSPLLQYQDAVAEFSDVQHYADCWGCLDWTFAR